MVQGNPVSNWSNSGQWSQLYPVNVKRYFCYDTKLATKELLALQSPQALLCLAHLHTSELNCALYVFFVSWVPSLDEWFVQQ